VEGENILSLLRQEDYLKSSKKNNIVNPRRASHGGIATSKKVKIPTQHKSSTHKCAHCTRTDAKQYSISEKETRWLCPICVQKNINKDSKEKAHFVRASELRVKT